MTARPRSISDVSTNAEPVRFLTPEVTERGWHFGDPVEGPVAALMRRLDVWYIRHAREGSLNGWHYVVIAAPSGIAYQLSRARSRTEVAADLWLLRAARQASIHAEEKQRLMAAARPAARKSPQLPMPKPQPTIGPRQAPTSIRSEVAVREATRPPGRTVEFTPSQAAADALLASALAAGARSRAADRTSKDGPLVGQTPAVNRGGAASGPPAAGRPEVVPIAPPPPAPIHKTLLRETGSRATPFLAPEKARSQAPVRDPASPTELGQKTAAARLRAPVVWERERGFADFFTTPCRSAAQDGGVHLARLEAMLTEMGVVAAATHSRRGTPRMTRLRVKISDLATALGRLTESQFDQYEKRLREATAEAHKNYAEHQRILKEIGRAQGMEI